MIILLATGTNKGGGYLASRGVFLCMYIGYAIIWAVLNTFALQVIAFLGMISIWWQVCTIILLFSHYHSWKSSYLTLHASQAKNCYFLFLRNIIHNSYCLDVMQIATIMLFLAWRRVFVKLNTACSHKLAVDWGFSCDYNASFGSTTNTTFFLCVHSF